MIKKTLSKAIKYYRFVQLQKKQSSKVAKYIESLSQHFGRLPATEQKKCMEYCCEVLGSKFYTPYYVLYTTAKGKFIEGYVPQNFYYLCVAPVINGKDRLLANIRHLEPLLFGNSPQILSVANNKVIYNGKVLQQPGDLTQAMRGQDKVLFKLNSSATGSGIEIFNTQSLDINTLRSRSDGVLHEFVRQHHDFNVFQTKSLSTIRVTTVATGNHQIKAIGGFLRISAGNEQFLDGNSDYLFFDLESGMLLQAGLTSQYSVLQGKSSKGVDFYGYQIPKFAEIIKLALACHARVPHFGCIGWDIAVDHQEKLWLLEWNAVNNGISYDQVARGNCFKSLGWHKLSELPYSRINII